MALHDVDKSSEDRGTPTPNTSDKIIDGAIKSHKTISTHYTTDADTNPGRLQMENKQIIGNDGTTPITLYGYNQALNKWGLFVTKSGVDVTTNTDLSQFIFNSGQDIFKIVATGTITLPTVTATVPGGKSSASTSSITSGIPHGLSFTPIVLGVVPPAYTIMPQTIAFATNSGAGIAIENNYLEVDATNVYAVAATTVYGSVGTTDTYGGYSVKYYLLQETAT